METATETKIKSLPRIGKKAPAFTGLATIRKGGA